MIHSKRQIVLASTLAAVSLVLAACHNPKPIHPRTSSAADASVSPLGPSYVLLPLPSDDDQLLGRIVRGELVPGATLEEISRPNPCAQYLTPPKSLPLSNRYEDAKEMEMGAKSAAFFSAFGFSGQASDASHFVYKIETDKREGRTDTNEYVQCCKENDCGYGFVSALVHGTGLYAAGRQTSAQGGATVMAVASAEGFVKMRVLRKRNVKGWIAALVTITDPEKGQKLGTFGDAVSKAGITEETLPQNLKDIYENNKVSVLGSGSDYVYRVGDHDVLTENEFIRRYKDVTGSDELDKANKRRNNSSLLLWGGLTAASGVLAVYGGMNLKRNCNADDWADDVCRTDPNDLSSGVDTSKKTTNWAGYTGLIAGGLGVVGFGIPLISAATHGDGSPSNHLIEDADARFYVSRYNKVLLRKTVRRLRSTASRPTLRMFPMVATDGTMGFGFQGTF